MSWLDRYRQASYKNINFFVSSHNFAGGKRGKTWEFPFKNTPYNQKLGNKVRKFNIEGYLVGEDYDSQRNELITELEKNESGKLVHPYYGDFIVDVMDWSFREVVREGSMVRFTLQCVESGQLQFPSISIDTQTTTALQKETVYTAIQNAFVAAYNMNVVPYSVAQTAITTLDKGLDSLATAKTAVSSVSEFKRNLESISGQVLAIAYDGLELAQNVIELMQFGTNFTDSFPVTVENSRENFENMESFFEFSATKIVNDNIFSPPNMIATLYQMSATISACTLLTVMEFDSYESSIEFRDIAINKLDYFLELVEDEDSYYAMYDLRAQVINDLEIRSQSLPRLSKTLLNVSLPALVLSHNLYQSINHEQDIIDRNNIFNPAFLPGGVELEVVVYE